MLLPSEEGGGVSFVGDEISGLLKVFLGSFGWIVEEDKKTKSWGLLLMVFCGEGEKNCWFFSRICLQVKGIRRN